MKRAKDANTPRITITNPIVPNIFPPINEKKKAKMSIKYGPSKSQPEQLTSCKRRTDTAIPGINVMK
nr:hypothetical protein [Providencia alcalifaciens]